MKKSSTPRLIPGWLPVVGLLLMAASARADYESTILADHPIAYFALDLTIDNSGTATDLSGNGNNSAYYNIYPSTGPSSYLPNAANFAGAYLQSYVDLGTGTNTGVLNYGGPITMEAWVQSTNTTQGPADIIGKGYDSSMSYDELCLRANGGVNYYGGTYNNVNGGASASGGQQTTNWTYLVATYDGTNWNLYVNTKLVGTGADSVGAINFPDAWRIGTGSADGSTRYFVGNICQVALYTNALTVVQVLNHFYMGELNGPPSNSPPIIVTQPQAQSTFVGGTITFTVAAVSAFPTTNQWFKNNVPLTGQTNASLTLTSVSANDVANYSVVVGNTEGTTNSTSASLTLLASGNSLLWSPNGNTGVWDTTNSANWINQANNQQVVFNSNDQVLFDDTVGVPTSVTINGTVSPSVLTVNSSTNTFTLNGPGTLSGAGSLIKEGSSLLTIVSPGNFTGPVTLSGGTIYAGNNSFRSVSSITITNNSTLDFGGGGYNNNQPVLVSGTGVNGFGALYNSYDDYPGETLAITLAGDTTFGGTNRWDLYGSITGPHKVTINWSDSADGFYGEWNTIAISTNVGDLELQTGKLGIKNMGSTFGNPSANFIVDSGTELDFWTGDSGYAKNFHVLSSGLMQILTGFTSFNGNLILENGAQFNAYGASGNPTETMNGTITLSGVGHIVLGDGNFVFTNVFSGSGGFVWDAYNHQMILQAANTYTGPTIIGGGLTVALTGNGSISHSSLIFFGGSGVTNVAFDASGRSDQTLTLASGQTLGGIGSVNGKLVVSAGATLAPAGTNTTIGITTGANPVGAISASDNITLAGTTVVKLDGSGSNDTVQTSGTITYGGTLNLVNISGAPLTAGNSFQIFTAASYSGSFGNIVPATPGPGLTWDKTQLNAGIINVVSAPAQPVVSSESISSGNFILSGTNGTAGGNYVVLTSTNIALPLTDWTPLATNSFDNTGAFHATNAINPALNRSFYLIQTQ